MKSKLIQKSKKELANFVKFYETLTGGFKVDWNYLQNAKVRAFYNENGEIIGGYAVSHVGNFPRLRYFDFIGEKKNQILIKKGLKLSDFIEITYTFFNRSASKLQRIGILAYTIFDVLISNKKYVLGGGIVQQFNRKMKAVIQNVLFEGEILVYDKLANFTILYEPTDNLPKNLLFAVCSEVFKLVRRKIRQIK
jgi:hypothetical protein